MFFSKHFKHHSFTQCLAHLEWTFGSSCSCCFAYFRLVGTTQIVRFHSLSLGRFLGFVWPHGELHQPRLSHMFAVAGPQLWQNRCVSFIRCRRRQCFKGMDLRDDVLTDSCCKTSWFFSDGIFEVNSFGENLQSSNWGDLCMKRFVIQRWDLLICVSKIRLLPRNQEMPQAMETECPPEDLVFDNCVSGGRFCLKGSKSGFRNHYLKAWSENSEIWWNSREKNLAIWKVSPKLEVWEWSWQFQTYPNLSKTENHNKRRPGFR